MVKRKYNYYHRQQLKDEAKAQFGPEFNDRVEACMRTPEFQAKINALFGYPIGYMMDEANVNGGERSKPRSEGIIQFKEVGLPP